MKKSDKHQNINLLELKPSRNLEWEKNDKDEIILLVPKFQNRFLVKYVVPYLKKPFFRIKLDDYGRFIWNLCDGNMTVGEISDKMKEKFGENFDPKYDRIGTFVNQLIRDKFLVL